jgi:hypothetical protein
MLKYSAPAALVKGANDAASRETRASEKENPLVP